MLTERWGAVEALSRRLIEVGYVRGEDVERIITRAMVAA
jgi:hypothetical protein